MTVESLRVEQRSLRSSFTMCCTSIEDALKRDTSLPDLYTLQRQIMDKFARLDTVQEQILELLLGDETLSGEYEDDFNKAEKYRDKMNQLSAELEYAVNKSLNKPQSEAEISQGNTRKFKLPKLEPTRFNGDPKDFLNIWSQFEKIHIDSNIDDDDKMHYLIQCSVPGSKMFRLVSSFPPTKENYRKAVQQVKELFGREDLLVQIYIRDLLGLVMQNATGKIRLVLSELYDVLKSKLLALESLERRQEKFADFLEPLVESCLPEAVLRVWERCRNAETTSEGQDSGRSLDRLMTFLRKEVESEEMILLARTGLRPTQRQKVKANAEEPSLTTSAALVNTKGKRSGKPRSCLFCSQSNHWTSDCLIAKKLSLSDKKSILIRNRACFRCLNKGHNARSCRLKMFKSRNCDDKSHHALLCNKKEEFDLKMRQSWGYH
ncbi:putative RNA-directed DNA polymerase from transposon X-element [Trichonephila clavipes]|nr:putative RNA-directed DNA polymerase from transposon X-element [Trichonephila clavipes]